MAGKKNKPSIKSEIRLKIRIADLQIGHFFFWNERLFLVRMTTDTHLYAVGAWLGSDGYYHRNSNEHSFGRKSRLFVWRLLYSMKRGFQKNPRPKYITYESKMNEDVAIPKTRRAMGKYSKYGKTVSDKNLTKYGLGKHSRHVSHV